MKLVVFSVNRTINFGIVLALEEKGDRWIDRRKNIIIDFHVNYCNSTGLVLMTAWIQYVKRSGKSPYSFY